MSRPSIFWGESGKAKVILGEKKPVFHPKLGRKKWTCKSFLSTSLLFPHFLAHYIKKKVERSAIRDIPKEGREKVNFCLFLSFFFVRENESTVCFSPQFESDTF